MNSEDMLNLYELNRNLGMQFATASFHNSFYFHKYDNQVTNLDEDIAVEHSAERMLTSFGTVVVMHEVLRDAGALSLPVAPYAHDAVVDMVAPDSHVNGRMKLDAGGLCTA